MAALHTANKYRFADAALRRKLKAMDYRDSARKAAKVLRSPTSHQQRMKLGYLLNSIHRMGPRRIRQLCRDAGVPSGFLQRRLSELTDRQREALGWRLESL